MRRVTRYSPQKGVFIRITVIDGDLVWCFVLNEFKPATPQTSKCFTVVPLPNCWEGSPKLLVYIVRSEALRNEIRACGICHRFTYALLA